MKAYGTLSKLRITENEQCPIVAEITVPVVLGPVLVVGTCVCGHRGSGGQSIKGHQNYCSTA